jgi:hypothetical protein
VTGGWRKLRNEKLHDLCSEHNIVLVIEWKRMKWAGQMARMGKEKSAYMMPEGMKTLNRSWRRRKYNIKMYLSKWYGTVWIVLAWFSKMCSVGMLWTLFWTFGQGIPWIAKQPVVSQVSVMLLHYLQHQNLSVMFLV